MNGERMSPTRLAVERLTPIGATSRWGHPMPAWYWRLRNDRQATHHLGFGTAPVDYDECPYNRGTGTRTCNLGCWEEPECITYAPSRYGWPRRPLDTRRIGHRVGVL